MRSWALALTIVIAASCGKKSSDTSAPAPEVSGLAAVPASAEVVIGIDVTKVARSPLVQRAADQLLLRDPDLAARWQRLRDSCKLDLSAQVKRVMLAIGPHQGKPGTGPSIVVATGAIVENDLTSCVRAMLGQGGGQLSGKDLDGRTLYSAKDGSRTMYFAFGRADTVVLGANEAYVTEALGSGKKALSNSDLAKIIALADPNAPIWAAGRVDDRLRAGLATVTKGAVSAGPSAFVVAIDPTDGAKLDIGAVMANAADAKALETFAKQELGTLAMFAQMKGLQRVVDKLEVHADNDVLRLSAKLSVYDVNQLLSVLDGTPPPAQDATPPQGSGSGK
jgi:hypothetical protein